jgi:two-component system chemotaxis response regulator CheB
VTRAAAAARLRERQPALVVIGASAGALDVLSLIVPALPPEIPAAVAVVVHVPPDRSNALPEVLGDRAAVPVCEAEDKMPAENGRIYFAPPDYHLLVERDGTFALSADPPVLFSRPSIDVLFESAAAAFGPRLLGILLSGASADGARGLAAIRDAGGLTWVQAPETAAVPTMPEAALQLAPHPVLAPGEMVEILSAWGTSD